MKFLKLALVFASAMIGGSFSAFGAAGILAPPIVVTPLQRNVTYSETSPVLNTYAGFTVTGFTNAGPNTINDLTVMFEASVSDPNEKTLSLHLPNDYLAGLPKTCTWPTGQSDTVTITCKIKQFRSGDTFPPFTVFYKMPVKVVNGTKDGPNDDNDPSNDDFVSTRYTTLYAEGLNDCSNGCGNSLIVNSFPNQVLLGTTNPIDVKSGVPRNGARLFTGNGVPKNEPNKKFTEEVQIPSLATLPTPIPYATSELLITYVESTDTTNGVDCLQLGNFQDCPTYETRIVGPTLVPVEFSVANPLKIIYRIDSANVKRQPNQLFNNLEIRYTPDDSSRPVVDVPKTCMNDEASGDGIPCVFSFQCYKPNEKTPDLKGDCELVTLGLKNGRLAIR